MSCEIEVFCDATMVALEVVTTLMSCCPFEGDNFSADFGASFFLPTAVLTMEIESSRHSSSAATLLPFGVGITSVA